MLSAIQITLAFLTAWLLGQAAERPLRQERPPPDPAPQAAPPQSSPVAYFRQLLALAPTEREQELARMPESKRTLLSTKIKEYEAMAPTDRESRLRHAELGYYLLSLMRQPPSDRVETLKALPANDRPLIEERLLQWDILPPDLQQEVLRNDSTIHYFLRRGSSAQPPPGPPPPAPDPPRPADDRFDQWRALPHAQRQKLYGQFQQFFELPEDEKEKTLHALSDAERRQMEDSLRAFEQLPAHQRAACIESFRKFANLSSEEREAFLKNAERWQEMSPRDRQTWRNLINLLPAPGAPPLPPRSLPGERTPGTPTKLPALPGSSQK